MEKDYSKKTSSVGAEKAVTVDVYEQIKKNYKGMIAIFLIFAVIGYSISFFKLPVYRSKATMTVMYEGKSGESATGNYTYSSYITDTFVRLMKETTVLQKVASRTGYSVSQLKSGLSVTGSDLLIDVSFEDTNPTNAKRILNIIMNTAISVFDSVDTSGEPMYKLLEGNLKIFTEASTPVKLSRVGLEFYIMVVLGFGFAVIYAILCGLLVKKYQSAEEIENMLDIPVLTVVPFYHIPEGGFESGKVSKKK